MSISSQSKMRQFKVCQFETNPRTGEFIQSLEEIAKNLERYKSFTQWAWAIHDQDKVTQSTIDEMNKVLHDEAKKQGLTDESAIDQYVQGNAWYRLGADKQKHIHIAIKCKESMTFDQIARLLGVPVQCIKIAYDDPKRAKGAFMDCVEYLTHESEKEQLAGKHRYADGEIHANFDWRTELDKRFEIEEKYGSGRTAADRTIIDVLKYGKTVRQCYREMDAIDYSKHENTLNRARATYLDKEAPLPNTRISFYVEGGGGIGKDTLCELLARALKPGIEDIEDIVFPFGGINVSFDGYDGQPVIIWSEMRASDFLSCIGRKATLQCLEIHPKKSNTGRVNVKYGSTRLVHEYNIINGIEPYAEFITGLADAYTDKEGIERKDEKGQLGQFFRRLPIIIPLREEDFDILVNKGVFEGTREYEQYIEYKSMIGNFAKMQIDCGSNRRLLESVSHPAIAPIINAEAVVRSKSDEERLTEDEIRAKYADVGKQNVEAVKQELQELHEKFVELMDDEISIMGDLVGYSEELEASPDDYRLKYICEQLEESLAKVEARMDEVNSKLERIRLLDESPQR